MKKRILNIGCGNDTYGTDFVDVYPSRKEVIKCNLDEEKLPYKSDIFGEVYSSFNFEHLKNPGFVLKEMARVLKKDGVLILKTDNAGWWGYHNSKSRYKVHYGGYHFEDHGLEDKHYSLFTFHHLENHFKEAGLKIISSRIYQRDKLRFIITLINNFLNGTRFKRMAYPQIEIIGKK
ncbi:MAG: class I SAM-dependent methyltransferase [Patescibacteria group bacterium]|nr:class I SAM-dependent methyltransferase [Patescibacteria group bacterium]